jgi:hypothetical protein
MKKWLYKNKEINEISDLPNNAFGFVYQTTQYYGSHSFIKEANEEDLKREILEIAYHKKELTYLECKYQFTLGVLESRSYLNDNILGKFFDKDFA